MYHLKSYPGVKKIHYSKINMSVFYSESDITSSMISTCINSWISPIVKTYIHQANFRESDFMGKQGEGVSVDNMVLSMMFYAFKNGIKGGDSHWDEECYNDFRTREKVFDRLLTNIESMSTKDGHAKISSIKKKIRIDIESKEKEDREQIDTLGLFVDHPCMEEILSIESPREFVRSMQLMGSYPESDPGYYIHSIFRFHIQELHQKLVSSNKVIRFPSLQKILDIINPVSTQTCLPSEFREFMRKIGSSSMPVVSLPLPSKDGGPSVVYGYNFENIKWIQATRQRIYNKFVEWGKEDSTVYNDIYPCYLKMGNPRNKDIMETMATSMDMDDLKRNYESFKEVNVDQVREILQTFPDIVELYNGYKNTSFTTTGEQLRERRGYFMHPDVRGLFNKVFKKFPGFFHDVHKTMGISHDISVELNVFFRVKKIMTFNADDDELWRTFLLAVEKVCLVFYVFSRENDMKSFFSMYETSEKYVASVVNK